MFIGHIPAGYVATKILQKKLNTKKYLIIGLIGSILPDLDMFYFYLIDNKQTLHHDYWIHLPCYWLIISIISFTLLYLLRKKEGLILGTIFFTNIFLHLFLDTLVGGIKWLYPFKDKAYFLFDVPAVYDFWVYNFIFHWTFLFEIGAIIWCFYILINNRKS